jgi:DNA-directed RNA polymerase specialized sigma24 family protein
MDGGPRPPKLKARISPVDRFGRSISPTVLDAAEEIVRRAIEHAEQLLIDPAIAATLLEEAASAVSRVLQSRRALHSDRIRDLPSYLFRAFIRRVNRVKRQQLIEEAGLALRLKEVPRSINPKLDLEIKILIDELLTRSDPKTRDVFYRRIHGFSWKEIGTSYGISAHAAESSFGQAIRRLAKRLGFRLTDRPLEKD